MSDSSDDRNPVERLAEEYLECHRRGEHPSLTEFVRRYPHLEDEIRDLFPALVLMERLKPDDDDVTGSFLADAVAPLSANPLQIGDFHILRELGRGGMGIVYEAVQESLGRHVALKVLPSHALLNPSHLQRFRREAKAAGRLHHTNIVPVFGVGESDGLHYYVMQYIAGSGLHEVVSELRRLRAEVEEPSPAGATPTVAPARLGLLSRSLLTGGFASTEATPDGEALSGVPAARGSSGEIAAGSAILASKGRAFAREVARLGLQVANALTYAHRQGVLHRDIKPSNLLLDLQGTVWVADFGLAKALGDREDVTHEGDLVGTLRYMAPERFLGAADQRSDLYALGLTLYELLALRPAFDQIDRDRLIHQVTTEVPPRLRSLNHGVPRDLETIIHKAIEHDPNHRYPDAGRLADDLERFLTDRPISVRAVGPAERLAKWARRRPAIAALVTALAAALFVGVAGIAWQWHEAVVARDEAHRSAARALSSLKEGLGTVNQFCIQVSEEELLEQPRMLPLRRRLLTLALGSYQAFQRQYADDRALRNELALSFQRAAALSSELGEEAQAHTQYLRARNLLEELQRENPGDSALALQLVRCYLEMEQDTRLSDFLYVWMPMEGPHTARGEHPALRLMAPFIERAPDDPQYLLLLGRCHDMMAMKAEFMGLTATAEKSLGRAVDALRRARAAAPDDPAPTRWLSNSLADLGAFYETHGARIARLKALEESLTVLPAHVGPSAGSRRDRLERGRALVQVGLALADLGQFEQARRRFLEALDPLVAIVAEVPESIEPRFWLARGQQGMSSIERAVGSGAAVRRLTESIRTLEQIPERTRTRRGRLTLAGAIVDLYEARFERGERGEEWRAAFLPRFESALADHDRSHVIKVGRRAAIESRGRHLLALEAAGPSKHLALEQARALEQRAASEREPENHSLRLDAADTEIRLASLLADVGRTDEAQSALDQAFHLLGDEEDRRDFRWRSLRARAWVVRARIDSDRIAADRAVTLALALERDDRAYAYDLAAALAVLARLTGSAEDKAAVLDTLHRAVAVGFDNAHQLRTDPRFAIVAASADFPTLNAEK